MVPEDYVHRIGRTGRAGATGDAISLVCVDEAPLLRDIERLLGHPIPTEVIAGLRAGPLDPPRADPPAIRRSPTRSPLPPAVPRRQPGHRPGRPVHAPNGQRPGRPVPYAANGHAPARPAGHGAPPAMPARAPRPAPARPARTGRPANGRPAAHASIGNRPPERRFVAMPGERLARDGGRG